MYYPIFKDESLLLLLLLSKQQLTLGLQNAVIGSKREEHDLSALQGFRLRSHGGLSEQEIPLIRSTPLDYGNRLEPQAWRNFDIFDVALNW